MSDIQFSASLNKEELEKGFRESNKSAGEWAKGIERAGEQADQGLSKMTKSFKESIDEQKKFIQSIEFEIKRLQKAYDAAAPGVGKGGIGGLGEQLRHAKRSLAEEQGKLIELQKEQTQANQKEDASTQSLTSSISKWALSLGGAVMILNTLKKALLETTVGLNIFNQIGAVTKQILNDIVTGVGFSMVNIQNAIQVQRQLNAMRLEDKVSSYEAAKYMNQYYKLYSQSIDQTKNYAERLRITNEAIDAHNKAIDAQIETTKKHLIAVGNLMRSQPDVEKLKMQYIDLMTTLVNLDTQRDSQIRRLISQRSGYEKEEAQKMIDDRKKLFDAWGAEIERQNKIWEERNDIAKKITEQEKLLVDAVVEGTDKEVRAIGRRIAELKKELEIREDLKKSIIDAMAFEGFVPSQITGGLTTPSVLPQFKQEKKSKTVEQVIQEMNTLSKASDRFMDQAKIAKDKANKDEEEALEKQLKLRWQITDGIYRLADGLREVLGLDQKQLEVLNITLNTIASGDFVGGTIAFISTFITTIAEIFTRAESSAEIFERRMAQLNHRLEENQRLIDKAARGGGTEDAYIKRIMLLREQLAEAQEAMRKFIAGAPGHPTPSAAMMEMLKESFGITEILNAIEDISEAWGDFMRGGMTENTIADTIAQGFQEGKTSVDDFADYMNQVLMDAVVNIFKENILQSPLMKAYIDAATLSLSDNILTEEEKNNLIRLGKEFSDTMKPTWEGLTSALDMGGDIGRPGLTGQIQRSITEETGSLLAGLWRKSSDDTRQIRDYSKMGVDNLMRIEANTAQTVTELRFAVVELKSIVNNTKPVYVNDLG